MKLLEVPRIEIRRLSVAVCEDVDAREPAGLPAIVEMLRGELQGLEQEHFIIIVLDGAGRPIAIREVAKGPADHVEVPTRELFRSALAVDGRAIILSHNHPMGDPRPSEADKGMTMKLALAGETIGMPIVDHIIIGGGDRFYSFAEAAGIKVWAKREAPKTLPLSGARKGPELDDEPEES